MLHLYADSCFKEEFLLFQRNLTFKILVVSKYYFTMLALVSSQAQMQGEEYVMRRKKGLHLNQQ